MKVESLTVRNFRNIEEMDFVPDSGVNVIYGENAQGKSNLLEAMWLFSGLRSFRGSKEKELIRFGADAAQLKMEFNNDIRNLSAQLDIGEKKKAILGGVPQSSSSKLIGEFLAIIFSPGNLELVRGGPAERRKFINAALCQLKPNYASRLSKFNRILQQRNILLKDISYHSELLDTLEIWDERFAKFAAYLILERENYLAELEPFLTEFYEGISGGREKVGISYSSDLSAESKKPEELMQEIILSLKEHRRDDMLAGYTTAGPHRDDLTVTLNGMNVKTFGSQGQQRSCALSMKMAEGSIIRQFTGKQPVVLLDDVMSELDIHRQDYILNHIEGWQVFITCCEPSEILKTKSASGKMFEIKEGKICSST